MAVVAKSPRERKVEKFLGEGSFGRVAKCKKLGTDKVVAIKIVSGSAQTEINLLKELSKIDGDKHNLVKMVDCFRYKSYTCIAMELLDQSLYDFMRERYNQPLTVEEIKTIAWQMIVALKGLESINLVHCDIKLDNIMLVDQVSEPFRVKLIDFGVSDKITNMRTGCLMQNMVYRAPEVHLGLPLDQRVDMWSLGYVLCVLYTGTFIHGWDSEYDIIRAMVNIFFTKTEENSGKKLWKLDTPLQQSLKTEKLVSDRFDFWSFDQLIPDHLEAAKKREVEQFVDLLKRMLMMDPSKRISPSEALRHPFFTLGRMQPTAGSNNTKPAAVEVHQQHEATQATNVPQRPAAVLQESHKPEKKPGRIQQQRDAIKNHQGARRKRNPATQQNRDFGQRLQTEAEIRRRRF
uniref:Protein kinase domain-containing protein n=1 Tax=Oryzias melastigma TaxID=30732 RepID=A0A3B3CXH0_ORYME